MKHIPTLLDEYQPLLTTQELLGDTFATLVAGMNHCTRGKGERRKYRDRRGLERKDSERRRGRDRRVCSYL